jgi:hypothetical protein
MPLCGATLLELGRDRRRQLDRLGDPVTPLLWSWK